MWRGFHFLCGDIGMASETTHPLTTEEAKARLRLAAQRASPVTLVERFPLQSISLALVGGFVVGRQHMQSVGLGLLASPLLLRVVSSGLLKLIKPESKPGSS